MRPSALLIPALLAAGAATAQAQAQAPAPTGADSYVLLSDGDGGRTYIGLPLVGRQTPDEPIEAFTPATLSGTALGDLFAQLCLAKPFDRAAYDAARQAATPAFVPSVRSLPYFEAHKPLLGTDKVAATQIVQDHAPYGIASLWLGEGVGDLAKRQYLRYSGSLIVTGPVSAKDLYAPQCNLTVRVTGLASAAALLDRIEAAAPGATLVKRTEKPKYAYARWTTAGPDGRVARITANASDLHKPAQTVHLTIQLLPPGKAK